MSLTSLAAVPITTLKGVGAKVAEKLARINIRNIEDALFHLPLRYEDRTRVYNVADCMVGQHLSVVVQVTSSQIQFGKRRSLVVKASDPSGTITFRFFHFSAAQKNQLEPGTWLKCFGEVKGGRHGPEMLHPEYRQVNNQQAIEVEATLTPVYPTTDGVKQATLRSITEQALSRLEKYEVTELLTHPTLNHFSLKDALHFCHRPPVDASLIELELGEHPAQQRLAIEELVAHQLSLISKKTQLQTDLAPALNQTLVSFSALQKHLPFAPTNAQNRVFSEIYQDMQQAHPMMRLVQGDVGSGKTLVAAMAALAAMDNGLQVALMAPTEILAEQHFNTFSSWLAAINKSEQVAWLSGKTKAKQKEQTLESIASNQAKLIIGTHAIFQDKVQFAKLGLIIIDEQHRFGVQQRLELRSKGFSQDGAFNSPHQLVMTATPIPRTLAMTSYVDLDCSVIDELPPGRTPVSTVAIPNSKREQVLTRVEDVCHSTGQQAYWVCTLIEESEALQCQAAEDTQKELTERLTGLSVGLVHGRMKPSEKQTVMEQFKAGEINVLVATTVIEVGVDVPNASLMIIENPERLGLAQLHQLRGRVGRGALQSHCVLLYNPPLSNTAQQRLAVLRDSNDGFVIAEKDLEIRGAGEIIGTRQTGQASFKIADLDRDSALVPVALSIAQQTLNSNPDIIDKLISRWLGDKQIFSNA
jgi:ATP-dependent DNA helicase RecG